jgi:hypothetical protein
MVIVYKCKISLSEMFDDEEPYTELFNGQVYRIPSKKIQDEAEEDECLVNNVVSNFRYFNATMDKKAFLSYFKAHAKKVLEILTEEKTAEEEIAAFKKESANFAKYVNENFDNAEFYYSENGASIDAATVGIAIWNDDCTDGPNFYYLKHSLKPVKM